MNMSCHARRRRCYGYCGVLNSRIDIFENGTLECAEPPNRHAGRAHLLTFATQEPFLTSQRRITSSARAHGIDGHIFSWNDSVAKAHFREDHAYFTKNYGGAARWYWKPRLVKLALSMISDEDVIIYTDASRHADVAFTASVRPTIRWMVRRQTDFVPGLQLEETMKTKNYFGGTFARDDRFNKATKCDMCDVLFYLRLCKDRKACCDNYDEAPAVQTSFGVWRRTLGTMRFVDAWQNACTRKTLKRAKYGDQTIASLLLKHFSDTCGVTVPRAVVPAAEAKNINVFLSRFA